MHHHRDREREKESVGSYLAELITLVNECDINLIAAAVVDVVVVVIVVVLGPQNHRQVQQSERNRDTCVRTFDAFLMAAIDCHRPNQAK